MAARQTEIAGVIPVLVTPFTQDGDIDHDGVAAEVEHLLSAGVRWLALGYGSEVDQLSESEVRALTGTVHRALAGRGGLIGNVEMTGTSATCRLIERMARAGADAVLLRPAPVALRMDAAIAAVAERAAVDVVIQDAPQHTGVDLSPHLLARLLHEIPGVAAVKVEPAAAAVKIGAVAAAYGQAPAPIIAGQGGTDLVHEALRGARGTMPGPGFVGLLTTVLDAALGGNTTRALQSWARQLPFAAVANRDFDTFIALHKYLLVRRGVIGSVDRRVRTGMDEELKREIDRLVDVFGELT